MDLANFFEAIAPPRLRKTFPHSTNRTTIPAFPRHYLDDLKEWSDIRNNVQQLLGPLLGRKSNGFLNLANNFYPDARLWSACGTEATVVRLGAHVYERPTVRILEELFSIQCDFGDHQATVNIGDPDRVFFTVAEPDRRPKAKFLVEWRTPWALKTPENLIDYFNSNRSNLDDKVVKAVSQLYGYMTFNNLVYGGLCNYEALYLFRRTGDSGLEVSPPFLYSDRSTQSIVAALAYICKRVAQEQFFHYSPVERGPPETQTLALDDLEVEGSWDEKLTVPWGSMILRLSGAGRKNIATVMSGEIRPRQGAGFRYSCPAFFKVYDIAKPSNLDLANTEITAYTRLESLQGRYIPRLYAAGTTWRSLKILVMEDCGETAYDENMSKELWSQARKAIVAFHRLGAIHGDIRIDNFAIAKGSIRVIDLGLCRQGTLAEQAAELAGFDRMERVWEVERESDVEE
ncbi:hypothetical protein TWF730_011179 [Orbilia blumenaviensis]|uniref:Protein kinase domain-containing protein n=1 Tax=Orbilia blumenaviensis TaxID=1796055 RepID=A0AAV9UL37_9PEZI